MAFYNAECKKRNEIICITKSILKDLNTDDLPPGNEDQDYLVWDSASQTWIPQQVHFVRSITVDNLGSGQRILNNLVSVHNEDVTIRARTFISGDGSITFTPLLSGEIDARSVSGGGPTPTTGMVTTTDATPTTLETISLPTDDRVYHIWSRVVGRNGNGVGILGATFQMNAGFSTHSGTMVQQIGMVTQSAHSDNPAWDADFNVASSAVDLVVTGGATTIEWRSITYLLVSD